MSNIDYILDLFDWNQSIEKQEEGLKLAREVTSINVFLQPIDKKHNKNVWENCAKTLFERNDEELKPYLDRLMDWLVDMNWPGAKYIFDRLLQFKDKKWFEYVLSVCMDNAKKLEEFVWQENLEKLLQN